MRVVSQFPRSAKSPKTSSSVPWLYALVALLLVVCTAWVLLSKSRHTDEERAEASTNATTIAVVDEDDDTADDLQDTLDRWVAAHSSGYRVVVKTLDDTPATASYKPDEPIIAASTYKLFVAYAAYHQAETGQISLSHTLNNGKTVEQCIEQAIVRSDNACAEAIGFYVGWDVINELSQKAGFTHTDINNYGENGNYIDDKRTTASDLALLLEKLHTRQLLNTTHTEALLGYMKRQVYRSGIPAGVEQTPVADKVGFLDNITSDAAIVYAPNKPYILVILSTAGNNWANLKSLTAEIQKVVENS